MAAILGSYRDAIAFQGVPKNRLNQGVPWFLAYPDGREWRFHAAGGLVKI
jgi:hypothetical protein